MNERFEHQFNLEFVPHLQGKHYNTFPINPVLSNWENAIDLSGN